jgi:hypothetical protein
MECSTINDYINPFSDGFLYATVDFENLTRAQKITTVVLSILAGLLTFFLLGVGGFATLKLMVDHYKVEESESDISDVVVVENLTLEQLIAGESQKETNTEIRKRVSLLPESEQKSLLEQVKNEKRFKLIAKCVARKHLASRTCEFFEKCTWPNETLKKEFLPDLIKISLLSQPHEGITEETGFIQTGEASPPKGFHCHSIVIHTQNVFDVHEFGVVSPYLVDSIVWVVTEMAKEYSQNEVVIRQFWNRRLPAAMIAPLLPGLVKVPGLKSLKVTLFSDEDAAILRRETNFQELKIDVEKFAPSLRVSNSSESSESVAPASFKDAAKGPVSHNAGASNQRIKNDVEGKNNRDHLGGEVKVKFVDGKHHENGPPNDGRSGETGEDKNEAKGDPKGEGRGLSVEVKVDQKAEKAVGNAVPNLLNVGRGGNNGPRKLRVLQILSSAFNRPGHG